MEMSLKTWRLVMAPEGGTRKRVKAIEAGNYLALEQAVADARGRFKLPVQTPLVFCYEAGRDGFYPYRRLTEAGHEVWVIDSASIEVSRRKKQAKSDGIDGEKLAELMQRKVRGEQKALRIVRVPSLDVEDERLLPREREIILQDLGRLRNQIESILFTRGYRDIPKTALGLKAWVKEQSELTAQLKERLGREIERLTLLETQFHALERTMTLKVKQEQSAGIAAVARALMRSVGERAMRFARSESMAGHLPFGGATALTSSPAVPSCRA
jgi:transposase